QSEEEYCLLVCGAIGFAVVYENVQKVGLEHPQILSGSDGVDSILCAEVADVDWDGEVELVIGSYSREVLIYKNVLLQNGTRKWQEISRRSFTAPVYGLRFVDLIGDGMPELIVSTMYGVHMMRLNTEAAIQKVERI